MVPDKLAENFERLVRSGTVLLEPIG